MKSTHAGRSVGTLLIFAGLIASACGADDPRRSSFPTKASTSSSRSTTARPGAKGPLPDPVLLDGSSLPAEKKSEYGMIGEFELPGDENARTAKVGGPQAPGQQQPPQGGGAMAQAQSGGAQPQQDGKQGQAGGSQSNEQQAGAGKENQQGGQSGAGEAGAKPEGIQVAQLGGEPSGDQPAPSAGEKPPPVAIGDSAMRIPASQSAAGVVGAQQQAAPNTQHHEKGTGSGGKGPTGVRGSNRVEKGRAIPAGL